MKFFRKNPDTGGALPAGESRGLIAKLFGRDTPAPEPKPDAEPHKKISGVGKTAQAVGLGIAGIATAGGITAAVNPHLPSDIVSGRIGNPLPEGFKESPDGAWLVHTVTNEGDTAAKIETLIKQLRQVPHQGESVYLDFSNLPLNTEIPETEIRELATLTDAVVIARPGGEEVSVALADRSLTTIRLGGAALGLLGLAGCAVLVRNIRTSRKAEKKVEDGKKKGGAKEADKGEAGEFPKGTFTNLGQISRVGDKISFEAIGNIRQVLESLPAGEQARELLSIADSITRIKYDHGKVTELELGHAENYESLKNLSELRRLTSMPNLQLDLAHFPKLYAYNGEMIQTWMNNQDPQITDRTEVELYNGKLRRKAAAPKPGAPNPPPAPNPVPNNPEQATAERLRGLDTSYFSHLNLQSGIVFKTNPEKDCKAVIAALDPDSPARLFLDSIPSIHFFNYENGEVTGLGMHGDTPNSLGYPGLMTSLKTFHGPNTTFELQQLPSLTEYYVKQKDGYHLTNIAKWMAANGVTDRSQVILDRSEIKPKETPKPAPASAENAAALAKLQQLNSAFFHPSIQPEISKDRIDFRTADLSSADMLQVVAALPETGETRVFKEFLEKNPEVTCCIEHAGKITAFESKNAETVPVIASLEKIIARNSTFKISQFRKLVSIDGKSLQDMLARQPLARDKAVYDKGMLRDESMGDILASIRRIIAEDGGTPEPQPEGPLQVNTRLKDRIIERFGHLLDKSQPTADENGISFKTEMVDAAELQKLVAELPDSPDIQTLKRHLQLSKNSFFREVVSIIYIRGEIIEFKTAGDSIPDLPNLTTIAAINATFDLTRFQKLHSFMAMDGSWADIKQEMQKLGTADQSQVRINKGKAELIVNNPEIKADLVTLKEVFLKVVEMLNLSRETSLALELVEGEEQLFVFLQNYILASGQSRKRYEDIDAALEQAGSPWRLIVPELSTAEKIRILDENLHEPMEYHARAGRAQQIIQLVRPGIVEGSKVIWKAKVNITH